MSKSNNRWNGKRRLDKEKNEHKQKENHEDQDYYLPLQNRASYRHQNLIQKQQVRAWQTNSNVGLPTLIY